MPDVDPSHFRQLLGRFTTGVVVITTRFPDGRPVGMTANSLASVSLQPPLISVCVEHGADMRGALLAAPGFIIKSSPPGRKRSRRFAACTRPARWRRSALALRIVIEGRWRT
jgi:flavin reductase (DIM6/NTAB) family NADH-FMN oxidoreductase RutF